MLIHILYIYMQYIYINILYVSTAHIYLYIYISNNVREVAWRPWMFSAIKRPKGPGSLMLTDLNPCI